MKHLMRIGLALTLALAAYGCGDDTEGDDAGTTPAKDGGTTCKTEMCGGVCCKASEKCNTTTNKCEVDTGNCTCDGRVCGADSCGNTNPGCGSCQNGQTCNAAGQCEGGNCTCSGAECGADSCGNPNGCGTCGTGEKCQAGQCVPEGDCNCDGRVCGPNSCGEGGATACGTCTGGQSCTAAGQCQAGCNPADCAQGQSCYNPVTGSTSGATVCTCLPAGLPYESSPDTCAQFGKVCDYNYDDPGASTCKVPGAYDECKPASAGGIGCETGLDCIGPFQDGTYMCAQPCTTGADCSELYEFCDPDMANHCYMNWCYNPYAPAPLNNRANYFQACDSAGTGDGTCTPLVFNDGAGGYLDAGLCWQAGTAASHGVCDPDATRANLNMMCPVNESCLGVQPGTTAGTTQGVCVSYCNAGPTPDPVLNCADAGHCLDVTGLGNDPSCAGARMGFCFGSCTLFDSNDQCDADALGNPSNCQPWAGTDTSGVCWPALPNAGAAGATCAMDVEGDLRDTCQNANTCLGNEGATSGNCYPLCDNTAAAGAAGACATGATCQVGQGQRIGYCE